jgi:hypothetical protein
MKVIFVTTMSFLITFWLIVGTYVGIRAYQKHKYVNSCIEKNFSNVQEFDGQLVYDDKIANEFCTCVCNFIQTKENTEFITEDVEPWGEFECAFIILIKYGAIEEQL